MSTDTIQLKIAKTSQCVTYMKFIFQQTNTNVPGMQSLVGQKISTPSLAKRPKQTSSVNLVNSAINAKVSSTTEVIKSSVTQAELLNSEKLIKSDAVVKKIGIQIPHSVEIV